LIGRQWVQRIGGILSHTMTVLVYGFWTASTIEVVF